MERRGNDFSSERVIHEKKEHVLRSLQPSPDSDLSRLRLELWGEGKMRAVFDIGRNDHVTPERTVEKEPHRSSLVKVDKGATEIAIRDVAQTGADDISKETREAFSRRLVNERFARRHFHVAFGDFVLPERPFLRKIPLSREAIGAFYPSVVLPDSFPVFCELTTLVYVQKKAPQEAFADSSYDVLFRCAELIETPSDAALFQGNRTFIDLHASWHDIHQLAGISGEVREIMRLAREDAGLRVLLQDFLTRAHAYTQDTGEVLDLFGMNNVRLYKDASDSWRLAFLDAYARGRAFAQAQEAVRATLRGYELTNNEYLALACSLNYARNMNALALTINAPQRFRLSLSDIAPAMQKIIPFLRKALASS
jgi:hypothetical protein